MKNNNVSTWFKCAGMRAAKTIAQTLIASIGTAAVISQVDWKYALSSAVLAGGISLLMSIAGLPELKQDGITDNTEIEKEE